MQIFEVRCPNCNSKLTCEDGFETYTCPFCDSEFILDGQNPEIIRSKVDLKIEEKRLENERHAMDLEYERKRQEANDRNNASKKALTIGILMIVVPLLILLFIGIAESASTAKANRERGFDPTNLNSMVKRVQELIDQQEFDKAEVVIKQINYTGSIFNFAERKSWNDTRKTLEQQLKDARKEAKQSTKQVETDGSSFWSFLPWVA